MAHHMVQATIAELTLRNQIKDDNGKVIYDVRYGHIYTDTVTGTRYYITIDDGAINKVEVVI